MIDRSKVIVTEMADEVQKTIQEELRGNDNMNGLAKRMFQIEPF